MTRKLVALCLALVFAGARTGRADLQLVGYDPTVNDRFNGSPNFIGAGYDFSAVGKNVSTVNTYVNGSNGSTWATLISPDFALTANHFAPAIGTSITFVEGNSANSPGVTDTVANAFVIAGSDLKLIQLTTPITTIAPVPIVANDPAGLLGQGMIVYGQSNRVGVNNVDGFQFITSQDIQGQTNPGESVLYTYDPNSPNKSLAMLQGGDSGGAELRRRERGALAHRHPLVQLHEPGLGVGGHLRPLLPERHPGPDHRDR